jgi:YVTN family beta-propeller protein
MAMRGEFFARKRLRVVQLVDFHAIPAVVMVLAWVAFWAPTAASQPKAYVTNEKSNDISVIDTGTDKVLATVPVGERPRGIRPSPDGKHVYVALGE